MGIYAGVNGVRRKISQPYAGVNGVRRTISKGFAGQYGGRYQFFGPLEDVARVEIRVSGGFHCDIDTSLNTSNNLYFNSMAEATRYAYISISGNSISVQGYVTGKAVCLTPVVYAVFSDGHEVPIDYISIRTAEYGAAISWPVSYYISIVVSGSGYSTGNNWNWCCGTKLNDRWFEGSISGTTTLNTLSESGISVGAGMTSGSGRSNIQMTFGDITIDGRNVPVRVVSQLT